MLRDLSFRFPHSTERVYGQWIYPRIAFVMGGVNGLVPFSLAEATLAAVFLITLGWLVVKRRRSRGQKKRGKIRFLLRAAANLWILSGGVGFVFLLLWGLNYGRPNLQSRLDLSTDAARAEEVLFAGRRCAEMASRLHGALNVPVDRPTRLPMEFPALNELIDRHLRALELPGYPIRRSTSPAKRLMVSPAISYLGLSGIFIPFTGEPSMNGMIPDVSVPLAMAHEKAHQRGITNEGEANLVAFLACARVSDQAYLRYAAYLFAASRLIGAASRYLPEEAGSAWETLGPGPRRDLAAVREFWSRYDGFAADFANKVNDSYLHSFRVPEGVQSYGQVTQLLVALHRQGNLVDLE